MKKVEGHSTLYKNEETGLILNTDKGQNDTLRDHYRLEKISLSNNEARDGIKDLKKGVEELKKCSRRC